MDLEDSDTAGKGGWTWDELLGIGRSWLDSGT